MNVSDCQIIYEGRHSIQKQNRHVDQFQCHTSPLYVARDDNAWDISVNSVAESWHHAIACHATRMFVTYVFVGARHVLLMHAVYVPPDVSRATTDTASARMSQAVVACVGGKCALNVTTSATVFAADA